MFIDEASAYLNQSREYGRAHSTKRVIDNAPKGKKERASLIAAVTSKGLAPEHCLIHPDSVNKSAFLTYLSEVLLPNLAPESILIMDNWTVHHGADIAQLVEAHGSKVVYLPTYSPDFNPIEHLFAKIKALIKKLRPKPRQPSFKASVTLSLPSRPKMLVRLSGTAAMCSYLAWKC